MKVKIFYVFLVLVLCFAFLSSLQKSSMPSYKILKVNDFGQFCIDINNDFACQEDEFYRLKDVTSYFPDETRFNKESNDFLKNTLQGKQIKLKEPLSLFYKYARVEIDNQDAAILLLKNGYAQPHNKNVPTSYFLEFNTLIT